jgi:hypothetical protein
MCPSQVSPAPLCHRSAGCHLLSFPHPTDCELPGLPQPSCWLDPPMPGTVPGTHTVVTQEPPFESKKSKHNGNSYPVLKRKPALAGLDPITEKLTK